MKIVGSVLHKSDFERELLEEEIHNSSGETFWCKGEDKYKGNLEEDLSQATVWHPAGAVTA